MAVVHHTYLFNATGFRDLMTPLVPDLEGGNFQSLYLLAKQTMEDKPELWFFLDDLILGPPLEEYENNEIAARRLLMMAMAPFVKPVSAPGSKEDWWYIKTALPLIGWSEHETRLLLSGESLCRLLLPDKAYEPTPYANDPTKTPWCEGYAGWQNLDLIVELLQKLDQSKEAYFELARHPEAARIQLPESSVRPRDWLSERLVKGYEGMTQVLAVALQVKSPLAVAIV